MFDISQRRNQPGIDTTLDTWSDVLRKKIGNPATAKEANDAL